METHPVERLFERLATFGPYPAGVVPMTGRIAGTAFFPGGAGLWNVRPGAALPPMPVGGVMVLAHNFDSETSFERSLTRGVEHTNGPTWGVLRKLFGSVAISMERCFFTNAYLGLKAGSDPTGRFPGADDPDFVRRCQAFLLEQVQVQQPTLILTLGKEVPPVLAPLAPELARWRGIRSLNELDDRGAALVSPVRFPGVAHPVTALALTHPSFRHLNLPMRRFDGLRGDEAERALLREALQKAANNVHEPQ